ncbi:helix-turn-helix domain-containing protein [Stutzerimonas chloritidismutans]|uniref:helix-turn-helix domain-containing protein n=1 Tax=Stutzerimonas chloritidismutans TaxID=203192 RepID=UPI003F5CBE98
MRMPPAAAVPVFKLYGDGLAWPTLDLMHCESIAERSRLHGWEIRPHRHADLTQLLYLRSGWAEVELEGVRTRIDEASLQVVPALAVHGFRFSEQVEGHVLTLAAPLLTQLDEALGSGQTSLKAAGLYRAGRDRPYLDSLFDQIEQEYRATAPARELQLQSLAAMLAVWVSRQSHTAHAPEAPTRGKQLLSQFVQLLEADFAEQPTVEQYARRLDITPAYLNTLARRYTGLTAQGMLHQRLLIEAKRQLVYTAMSVSDISDALGFSEPAYFSRFFKRLAGISPRQFRCSTEK